MSQELQALATNKDDWNYFLKGNWIYDIRHLFMSLLLSSAQNAEFDSDWGVQQ